MTPSKKESGSKAIHGGVPTIADPAADPGLFYWPIVTNETEQAVVEIMRTGRNSGNNVTRLFEAECAAWQGIRLDAVKHRLNRMCSAMGQVPLKRYPMRIDHIQRAISRLWSLLDGVPGLHPHRFDQWDSTKGGWYFPCGLYNADTLAGLPAARFCEAVRAEGVMSCVRGLNTALHVHTYFHEADVFHPGRPTAVAFDQRDVRQGPGSLPVSESIAERVSAFPGQARRSRPHRRLSRRVPQGCGTHRRNSGDLTMTTQRPRRRGVPPAYDDPRGLDRRRRRRARQAYLKG